MALKFLDFFRKRVEEGVADVTPVWRKATVGTADQVRHDARKWANEESGPVREQLRIADLIVDQISKVFDGEVETRFNPVTGEKYQTPATQFQIDVHGSVTETSGQIVIDYILS